MPSPLPPSIVDGHSASREPRGLYSALRSFESGRETTRNRGLRRARVSTRRLSGGSPGPYNPAVDVNELSPLPGAELVLAGLRDIEDGEESIAALLVLIGAPRLRSLGVSVPAGDHAMSPEHRLYARLRAEDAPTAHSRYNALVRRLVSFERALACASA